MRTETREAIITYASALARVGFAWTAEGRKGTGGIQMLHDAVRLADAIRMEASDRAIYGVIADCNEVAEIEPLRKTALLMLDNEGPSPTPHQQHMASVWADLLWAISRGAGHGRSSRGVAECIGAGLLEIDEMALAELTQAGRLALRTTNDPRRKAT